MICLIITIIKTTSEFGDGDGDGVVTVTAGATGWPVTVGVVEVGVVDTRYGVSQPGADADR